MVTALATTSRVTAAEIEIDASATITHLAAWS
jgi:hypothetical protein